MSTKIYTDYLIVKDRKVIDSRRDPKLAKEILRFDHDATLVVCLWKEVNYECVREGYGLTEKEANIAYNNNPNNMNDFIDF